MSENGESVPEEEPQETTKQPTEEVVRTPFNPMSGCVGLIVLIVLGYGLSVFFGYPALVSVMLFGLVLLYRETLFILKHYSYGFARKGAYFNAGLSSLFFIILFINSYSIIQTGLPLILPEIDQFTLACPLFIVLGLHGTTNIRRMYKVQK